MNQAGLPHQQQQPQDPIINTHPEDDVQDSGDDSDVKPSSRRSGRRKIKIEYIEDKNRRHITFSKRKAGIMKKAYELSTLTGTQVLLLVVSETGLVYTFTTVKLQPIVTKPEGKNLIQTCLNAPDPMQNDAENDAYIPGNNGQVRVDIEKKSKEITAKAEPTQPPAATVQQVSQPLPPTSSNYNAAATAPVVVAGGPYQQPPYSSTGNNASMPPMNTSNYGQPSYAPYQRQQQQSPQQQHQQQPPYMTGAPYYMQPQQHQQQQGYWPQQQQQQGNPSTAQRSPSLRQQEEDQSRRGPASK